MEGTDLEARVQELWDRDRIARLPLTYARGVDRRDWALVRSCFRDGAVIEGSRMTGPVDSYLGDLEPAVARYAATMHFMGNQLVDVEGDTGRCETYAVAYHWAVLPAGTPDEGNLVMAVRYLDSTVKVGGTWLIDHRHVEADWAVAGPASSGPAR